MTGSQYTWRDAAPTDLDGIKALEDACFQADGPEVVAWGDYPAMIASPDCAVACAVTADGQVAAAAWAKMGGSPAMLGGKVHPDHRRKGLGREAIRRAEEAARSRGMNQVFIRNEAFTDGAAALYERAGYDADFVEYWMSRLLDEPLPEMPSEVRLETWTDANALIFYETFIESFRDRGGPQRASAEDWISGNADDEDFRPDMCLLAFVDEQPAAFVTAQIFDLPHTGRSIGWISQIGVRPPWRGRGIVDGLIGEIGRCTGREGIRTLDLDVNLNNPRAIRAYERNGFAAIGRRAKFSKTLE